LKKEIDTKRLPKPDKGLTFRQMRRRMREEDEKMICDLVNKFKGRRKKK